MRNSELAKKLKARTAKMESENDKTSLLKGQPSSSACEQENDPFARFPFLAPFMTCQSPDVSSTEKKREIASPSGMNYFPARNHSAKKSYPLLNPLPAEEQSAVDKGHFVGVPKIIVDKPTINTLAVFSKSIPPRPQHKQQSNRIPADTAIENSGIERKLTSQSSVAESSFITCAPSSIIAGSASATCPTDATFSSLVTCAPSSTIVAASTSATCPSVPNDERASPRSEKKNLLRLIHDLDDQGAKANRARANTSPKRSGHSWKLSPFQKNRKGKKQSNATEGKRKEASTVLISDLNTLQQQRRRGSPVDLDEVSIDSHDDTEAGYYSDPTDADVRNMYLYRGADTDPSPVTGQNVPSSRKTCLDSERVLSQLGMDVRKEDYCIEGEYGLPWSNQKGHRRAGSGRWNYHQRKPSDGVGKSKLGIDEVIVATGKEQDGRRRGSKLGENIKESMKRIGSIIKLSDDDDSFAEKKQRNASKGSKVLSMFRGHQKANASSSIPHSITITPTSSEDHEITSNELELINQWQKARARCITEQSSLHIPVLGGSQRTGKSTHKRGESGVMSTADSMVSDMTAHVDNRGLSERL